MSIVFKKLDSGIWLRERALQSFKNKNIQYINDLIFTIENSLFPEINGDGIIEYLNTDRIQDKKNVSTMYYNYGSPCPIFCKILPDGYGWTTFNPNDIYKKCSVEVGIHKKLYSMYERGLFTRYTQPKLNLSNKHVDDYILVSMQNTRSTVWYPKNFTILANDIVAWSRENKKTVIFKWHNGCIDHSNPQRWFDELEEKSDYSFIDYTTPITELIKNCKMMWTASSMSGIEALICNKPVAIFGKTEYMEMAKVCDSPEEAYTCTLNPNLEQWLTYYFKYYCINIYSKNAIQRVRTRFINYFEKGMSLNDLILSQ